MNLEDAPKSRSVSSGMLRRREVRDHGDMAPDLFAVFRLSHSGMPELPSLQPDTTNQLANLRQSFTPFVWG